MESTRRPASGLSQAVAKEVRVLLIRKDMKQSELATRMGVGEMWLSRRLRGANPIDLDDLARIADALDVHVSDLLPRADEGRLITAAAPRGEIRSGTNERSTRQPERPHRTSHPNRTTPDSSTRRPARTHPGHTR